MELLSEERLKYRPLLPKILQLQESSLKPVLLEYSESLKEGIDALFPHIGENQIFKFLKEAKKETLKTPLKVGVLFSGGQASGGHNVVWGLYEALLQNHKDSSLIGFLNGPSGLIDNQFIRIDKDVLAPFQNQGGFHLLGSGRTKIETEEQFFKAAETLNVHDLDGLLIIGGDDSNTNAAFLAEYCKKHGIKTAVVGVPKTIDGDLKNEWIETSFGFDTASKIYSAFVSNVAIDALSAKKYYFFIKIMGRSASHLALECAFSTEANLTLIGEEIANEKQTLKDIACQISSLVIERYEAGKSFGVIVIPEGLLEFTSDCKELFDEINKKGIKSSEEALSTLSKSTLSCFELFPEEIQRQLFLEKDAHGNLQLTKIETERLLIALVEKQLKKTGKKIPFNPQPLFCGYEGRAVLPSNFDCNYGYALGFAAGYFIALGLNGYIVSLKGLTSRAEEWKLFAIPIARMLHFEERMGKKKAVIKKSLVDTEGKLFLEFRKKRKEWLMEDSYKIVGPIQFFGPPQLTDGVTYTLKFEVSS